AGNTATLSAPLKEHPKKKGLAPKYRRSRPPTTPHVAATPLGPVGIRPVPPTRRSPIQKRPGAQHEYLNSFRILDRRRSRADLTNQQNLAEIELWAPWSGLSSNGSGGLGAHVRCRARPAEWLRAIGHSRLRCYGGSRGPADAARPSSIVGEHEIGDARYDLGPEPGPIEHAIVAHGRLQPMCLPVRRYVHA